MDYHTSISRSYNKSIRMWKFYIVGQKKKRYGTVLSCAILCVKRLLNLHLHNGIRLFLYFQKETLKQIHKRPIKSVTCKELIGYLCPGEEQGEE